MVIKFNPISEVKETSLVGRIGQTIQQSFGQIFASKAADYGVGVTVESPRFAQLEEHFKDVPMFEYNKYQMNFRIKDDLMGVPGIDY